MSKAGASSVRSRFFLACLKPELCFPAHSARYAEWRGRGSVVAELKVAAAFESAGHGDLIGVLDVTAGGDAGGDAGDLD